MRFFSLVTCAVLAGCTSFGGDPVAPAADGGADADPGDAGSNKDSAASFPPGCLFCTDFEATPLETGWLLGGTADAVTYAATHDAPRSGTTAVDFEVPAKAGVQRRYFFHNLDAVPPGTTLEYTFSLRAVATDIASTSDLEIAALTFGAVVNDDQPRQAQVRMQGGAITARIQGASVGATVPFTGSQVLGAGWHEVKLTVELTTASTGSVTLTIDNGLVEKKGFDPDGERTDHFQIQLGCDYSDTTSRVQLDFDDVIVTVK